MIDFSDTVSQMMTKVFKQIFPDALDSPELPASSFQLPASSFQLPAPSFQLPRLISIPQQDFELMNLDAVDEVKDHQQVVTDLLGSEVYRFHSLMDPIINKTRTGSVQFVPVSHRLHYAGQWIFDQHEPSVGGLAEFSMTKNRLIYLDTFFHNIHHSYHLIVVSICWIWRLHWLGQTCNVRVDGCT